MEAFGADRFLWETTAGLDVVLANGPEAKVLTGRQGLDAARVLGERYRVAAVKLGSDGCGLSSTASRPGGCEPDRRT